MIFLILSYDNGQKTDEGIVLNVKLTHQNIADMTGLTRETVTRILDKWQSSGELTVLKNKLIRLNNSFLKEEVAM